MLGPILGTIHFGIHGSTAAGAGTQAGAGTDGHGMPVGDTVILIGMAATEDLHT